MIETPWITETTARTAATIHLTMPRSAIRTEMGPALGELFASIHAQDVEPAGPWFTRHLRVDPEEFDFEVCVPVRGALAAGGRVMCKEFPAVSVARTIHHGPYDGATGLAASWGELREWMVDNGHAAGPDLYECYLVGPDSTRDAELWRTELSQTLTVPPSPSARR